MLDNTIVPAVAPAPAPTTFDAAPPPPPGAPTAAAAVTAAVAAPVRPVDTVLQALLSGGGSTMSLLSDVDGATGAVVLLLRNATQAAAVDIRVRRSDLSRNSGGTGSVLFLGPGLEVRSRVVTCGVWAYFDDSRALARERWGRCGGGVGGGGGMRAR